MEPKTPHNRRVQSIPDTIHKQPGDPVSSNTELATIHLQSRPNTDGALALRSAHVIHENVLHDGAKLQTPRASTAFVGVLLPERFFPSPNGRIQYRPVSGPPLGESIGDTELVFALAERLEGTGLSFSDLPANGTPVSQEPRLGDERSYEVHGFGTPTGKVEFVCTELESMGVAGLPVYEEPFWSSISTPEISRAFPLVLTTGGRSRTFMHSQGRTLTTILKRELHPRVQIHAVDASDRGIRDEEWVEISSSLGEISMRAWVTDKVMPGSIRYQVFHFFRPPLAASDTGMQIEHALV